MRPLSASELLDVWERGCNHLPVQRALLLLAAASPDEQPEALAALRIGTRDARLLTLREWAFGARLESAVACPKCGEELEFTLGLADLRVEPREEPPHAMTLRRDGYEIRYRLPDSRDLLEVAGGTESHPTVPRLLERCILEARRNDDSIRVDDLPEAFLAAVAEEMALADPQADVAVALTCPACSHAWSSTFDIVSYFWSEIDAWAHRTLRDVHVLATAYGWPEREILGMSAWRRRRYLNLVLG